MGICSIRKPGVPVLHRDVRVVDLCLCGSHLRLHARTVQHAPLSGIHHSRRPVVYCLPTRPRQVTTLPLHPLPPQPVPSAAGSGGRGRTTAGCAESVLLSWTTTARGLCMGAWATPTTSSLSSSVSTASWASSTWSRSPTPTGGTTGSLLSATGPRTRRSSPSDLLLPSPSAHTFSPSSSSTEST